jgi:hypothetical protein
MTYLSKTKLHIASVALVVAASAAGTTASAFGIGSPLPPNLDFPEEGAFEGRSGGCFLFVCPAKPQVTKDAATTMIGE